MANKEVVVYNKPYMIGTKPGSIDQEMDRIRTLALAELDAKKTLSPMAFVFFETEQVVIPLRQFANQKDAQFAVANYANERKAMFFVVVGLTSQQNTLATQFTDYFLNTIGHQAGKVVWKKDTLLLSGGIFTVIKTQQDLANLESEKTSDAFKQLIEAEQSDFEVEGEDIGGGVILTDD